MPERLAVALAIIALTLLSYFQFPGHTYLGSDTQIYVPMLEHIWDQSALTRDLVATKPHLSFTLYDEIAIALRWLTHSSFQAVLVGQQLLFRALEILGVYLLAASLPLARRMAMLVAALFTLGATIVGPAVLTFEYEPVPRAFAVGLIFLAIGLAAQNHLMWADIAAALAFLYHPPTVWVFWALYLWLVLRHRDYRDLWPLAIGIVLLFASSRWQAGATEPQAFFTRVSPELEQLQRMRTGYNWVSTWPTELMWQYFSLWIVSLLAFWRLRPKAARLFLLGMPAIGMLSVPLSYLLLEKFKWGLIPQFQPARAVLFVTAFAVILSAAAGIRWMESALWFLAVFVVPLARRIFSMQQRQFVVAATLAIAVCVVLYLQRFRWAPVLLIAIAIVPFFAVPGWGHVSNYRDADLSGIHDLAQFARVNTPKDAVFLFGDAGTGPEPSIFRAESLRALYVDWKSGGQMNYHESLATEWSLRWRNTNQLRFDPSGAQRLPGLGIDYLVLSIKRRLPDRVPDYENSQFVVYRCSAPTTAAVWPSVSGKSLAVMGSRSPETLSNSPILNR
jgi:hypothetical protein